MDAGAEGRQSAFIALLADNRKCAMCLQKCAGAADVQGCMLGCSRDDEDQDEMAPNADLSGSRQDPTPVRTCLYACLMHMSTRMHVPGTAV